MARRTVTQPNAIDKPMLLSWCWSFVLPFSFALPLLGWDGFVGGLVLGTYIYIYTYTYMGVVLARSAIVDYLYTDVYCRCVFRL